MTVTTAPPAPASPLPAGAQAATADGRKAEAPTTRFVVERRTRGLVRSERVGCALATGVAAIPLALFGNHMLPLLQQENGLMLLLLSISMALGACVSIFVGMAASVLVWWMPRMLFLALHTKVRRTGVRAGVRSRGIWISGIGWMGWNGLHIREKSPPAKSGAPGTCSAVVIKSPEHGEMILQSPENVPGLLRQIRRYADAQPTEFQSTEIMPPATPAQKAA